MSDEISEPPPPASEASAAAPAKRRGFLAGVWRWGKRIGLTVAALLLIGRATIGLWLPKLANRAVAPYDLHVSWQDFDLSILGLSLDLVGVRVVPLPEHQEGTERSSPSEEELAKLQPLARLDDLGFDADVSGLLTGDLRVHRVEVGGLEAWLDRDAGGRWNYERHLPAPAEDVVTEEASDAPEDTEETSPVDAAEPSVEEPTPLDFSSPVEISTIDLAGVRLHLRDALAAPALDTALDLDVTVRDVGHPDRPIQARIVARAEEILDTLVLTADADLGVAKLLVDLKLQVDGVGVRRLAPYLEPLGIVPSSNKVNAFIAAQVDLAPVPALGISGGKDSKADEPLDLGGTITLSEVRLDADGAVAAELMETTVKVTRASSAYFQLESAICSGLDAHATRLPGGAFRVAGLDFVGAPPGPAEPEEEEEVLEEETASGPPASFRLERLALENANFTLNDESFVEPRLLETSLTAEVTAIVLDAAAPGAPLGIDLAATLKGAGSIHVTGSVVPTGDTLSADLELAGQELTLESIRPQLTAAGLSSTLKDGTLHAGLKFEMVPGDADEGEATRLEAAVSGLMLSDGDVVHLSLDEVRLDAMEQLPDGSSTIQHVGLAGASLPVDVFPGGAFRGFGIETLGLDPDAVGRRVGLDGAKLDVSDLAFGGGSSQASLTGSFDLIGLVQDMQLDGSIVTRDGPLDMDVAVSLVGDGLTLEGLRDVLAAQGIEPDFEEGQLRASAEVSLKAGTTEGTTQVDGRVFDLALSNRGAQVVAIDEARIAKLVTGPDGTSIGEVVLAGPRITAARDEAGILAVAGLRIGIEASGVSVVDPNVDGVAEGAEVVASAPGAASDSEPSTDAGESEVPGPAFTIDRVALTDLSAIWSDAFVSPSVQTEFSARAEVLDIDLGSASPAKPVRLTLEAGLAGALDSLRLEATAERSETTQALQGSLELAGLKAGPLASYLPPGTVITLEDGRLMARFEASTDPADEGGEAVHASITNFDYRDGPESDSLLAFESLVFDAPRLDSEGAVFAVETVALTDLIFDAERTAADRIEVLGLALVSAPVEEVDTAPEAAELNAGTDEEGEAKAKTPAQPGAANSVAGEPALPPTVTLGTLDLGIERFRYLDLTRPDAIPLDLSLALVTPGPQTLCLPDPIDLPPLEFSAVGRVAPIIENIAITAALEPFAADPGAALKILIDGITGTELVRIAPEAAASIDPSAYVNGSFEATADLRLALARRGPLDFNLDRGFGATFSIDQFALKENPEAVPTGFDRLDVEVKRVDPKTGDVRIDSIDLTGIYARVQQAEDGMTVAGLRFPSATPEEASTEEGPGTSEESGAEPSESLAPRGPSGDELATTTPSPETSIGRLTVSGLDFEFSDTTTEPALHMPIADLQLEVKRFTTRTFEEPVPFSFQVIVDAGEIELEERTGADNLLFDVLGSAASAVTLGDNEFKRESRRVWDLLEAKGRVSLGPETKGRLQLTLLGLELPAFRGPARAAGVEIGDGLMDNRTSLRFREDGGLGVDTKTTTSYLSLSEPPDGPISKYLSLPAPLDTVLFLLRNSNGEQDLPVRLDIPADGVSGTQIAGLAANTLGVLITDAVSSAPLRVLGPLESIAGALGLTGEALTADTVTLEFTEGAATMVAASVVPPALPEAPADGKPTREAAATVATADDPLAQVVLALKSNPDLRVVVQAELGEGDIDVAQGLANPSRESIESLIQRSRYRKATLERERARLAARAKAQIYAGASPSQNAKETGGQTSNSPGAADLIAQLQSLDSERASVERALDDLFTFIRPGAERRADMRTRNAALALANQRLERVRIELVSRVGSAVAQRIDVRRARYRKGTEEKPLPTLGRVTVTPK